MGILIKSIIFVLKENFSNIYRIFSIAKYELIADMRDSKLGVFWNFASPAVQILTYWLVIGIGLGRGDQQGINYVPWIVVGYSAWWLISPCMTQGCSAIFSKAYIIEKMKFPVSILPATVCVRELFNHLCMLLIAIVVILTFGFYPNIYWLGTFYYMLCAFVFLENLTLITSVLTMMWRDIKKFVTSIMRMLLYLSPVIWTASFKNLPALSFAMKLNPIYYIVQGYRDCLLFKTSILAHPALTAYFWGINLVLFCIGCLLMYHFKNKMIDML